MGGGKVAIKIKKTDTEYVFSGKNGWFKMQFYDEEFKKSCLRVSGLKYLYDIADKSEFFEDFDWNDDGIFYIKEKDFYAASYIGVPVIIARLCEALEKEV